MAYEIYKKKLSKVDYFKTWDNENYNKLDEALKEHIYQKYLMKCEVLNRDGFECQNVLCLKNKKHNELTVHHIRWQKNDGKHTVRNGVTLCISCHHAYHKAKRPLKFPEADYLPPKLRGHTFKVIKSEIVDMKAIRKEMKLFRKRCKEHHGIIISWEQLYILMRFLEMSFDED